MTLGKKIKIIRTFRKLTQKQLGIEMGFIDSNADVRIRQYEQNSKVPRDSTIEKLAEVLRVNLINFKDCEDGSAEYIMQVFFWLEETSQGLIRLFPLVRNSTKVDAQENSSVMYSDGDNWPAYSPTGIWINNRLVDEFIREWLIRKNELKTKKITKDEYLEWKLNWPYTCDDCGKREPKYKWR